ncbi:UDP-glycosyltransferase 73C1-like [Cucurbita pepo subsp. pepo]|uniref:UDP-glycosyltransferase 73C1-like n=1 Tax=Cucurbita pepo subsp. pepo TaxID=3664 RepID=UPI000C9D9C10|nr:UDP-glycosyltransferase 73C1-like [Cucurbita pepo subsp. pepo]
MKQKCLYQKDLSWKVLCLMKAMQISAATAAAAAAKHIFSNTPHPMASSNSSNNSEVVHFVLFPLMARGHTIPMVDIAKLLSQASPFVHVTILTTPHNATRLKNSLLSHPRIHLTLLQLCHAYQTMDHLPSFNHSLSFLSSLAHHLQPQALALCKALSPKPTCIISDICLPWTLHIASHIGVPWLSFNGGSCFGNVAMSKILGSGICETVASDGEYFEVPGLEHRIEVSKAQLPIGFMSDGMMKFIKLIGEAERKAYGMVVNSFEELEGCYVRELKKMRGDRVWCIGPVSLCNKRYEDKAERGSVTSKDSSNDQVMIWLDSQHPNSVLYVCLGSLHNLKTPQLIELGLGLEASKKAFIWVVRASNKLEKWIEEEGFEERMKGRGVIIRDWAPQLLILSHPAIGGFLTHCGWNSILEGVAAGLPMLTWPLFSDQFLNEKFVADVLNIGVKVGAQYPVMKMKEEGEEEGEEEEEGMVEVRKEDVKEGIERVMGEGEEAEERRKKAREVGVMANKALEDGCSSHLNIALLIDDILKPNNISA